MAGAKLTEQDRKFIEDYGQTLGRLQLYSGNAWLTPRDDFAMVTPVFASPSTGRTLYAGVARPQAIYVIAPDSGTLRLFAGAVLSYREFQRPAAEPLTDEAWRDMVKAGTTPPPPPFTASFAASITVEEVVRLLKAGQAVDGIEHMHDRRIVSTMLDLLRQKEYPDEDLLMDQLKGVCTEADLDLLLDAMQTVPIERLDDIARIAVRISADKHRDAVMKLLHAGDPERSIKAAEILFRNPELVDVAQLARDYDKQEPHVRTFYCCLLGRAPKPGPEARRIFLRALGESGDGLRWHAVNAIGRAGFDDPECVDALVQRLEDESDLVAATAAYALVQLKANRTAPAILARLEKELAGAPSLRGHRQTIERGEGYYDPTESASGSVSPPFSFGRRCPSLSAALIDCIGAFHHAPGKEMLEGLLKGRQAAYALGALAQIDPAHQSERLISVALAEGLPDSAYTAALETLRKMQDPALAKRLVPLLDRSVQLDRGSFHGDWRLCDEAAVTIASMLGWKREISSQTPKAERDRIIEGMRVRVKELP